MTDLEKRLLRCMQNGIVIQHRDGHRWIVIFDDAGVVDAHTLADKLTNCGHPPLETKCYGSVLEALATVDEALVAVGEKTLLEQFNEYDLPGLHVTWGLPR